MGLVKNKFIGSGLVFPIIINGEGRAVITDDITLIRSSIFIILNWVTRTRYFNELFGSRIEEVLEEPDDSVAQSLIRQFTREALDKWEKRIILQHTEIQHDKTGRINLRLTYSIRNTKVEETYIYPFYKEIIY